MTLSSTRKMTATARKQLTDLAPTDASGVKKLFVLDTNVLIHDPMSLFRFKEHDVLVPIITIEELDNNKSGRTEVARNARSASRNLEWSLRRASERNGGFDERHSLPLIAPYPRFKPQGRIYLQNWQGDEITLADGKKNDNIILGVAKGAAKRFPDRHVVLVSKDTNVRIKGWMLDIPVEDYTSDTVLSDSDIMPKGHRQLPKNFFDRNVVLDSGRYADGRTWSRLSGNSIPKLIVGEYVYLEPSKERPFYGRVVEKEGRQATIASIRYSHLEKRNVLGVVPLNREQAFGFDALLDPEVDFVSLVGLAGTGKTLLALAAGVTQVYGEDGERRFDEVIATRATVPTGEDIGFLPGTEEEKMNPWMGAIDDNLSLIARVSSHKAPAQHHESNDHAAERLRKRYNKEPKPGAVETTEDSGAALNALKKVVRIKSMAFMRGRSFPDKWVVIDECQNLTPKQMKMLISRAGPGTKVVCLGNTDQIDTPYLTEQSCGLTFTVLRFAGRTRVAHIFLPQGERSYLADLVNEVL